MNNSMRMYKIMKNKATFLFIVLLLSPSLLYAWEGKVVSVTDGDTIKALKDGKQARADAVSTLKKRVADTLIPDPKADDAIPMGAFKEAWHSLEAKVVRDLILDGTRPDGRGPDELRDISGSKIRRADKRSVIRHRACRISVVTKKHPIHGVFLSCCEP